MRIPVGAKVKVTKISDEVGDPDFIGRVGTVTNVQVKGADVGESESDPYVTVSFGDVSDGFWAEELEVLEGVPWAPERFLGQLTKRELLEAVQTLRQIAVEALMIVRDAYEPYENGLGYSLEEKREFYEQSWPKLGTNETGAGYMDGQKLRSFHAAYLKQEREKTRKAEKKA